MPTQPALDDAWDIYLADDGDLAMVSDGPQVIQHVNQRLRFHRGEWQYDLRIGVPWRTEILGNVRYTDGDTRQAYAESFLKDEILETPEVTRLVTFEFTGDAAHRTAQWSFRFDTDYGQVGSEYFRLS